MTDLEILKARAAAVPAGEMVAVYAETVRGLIEENERLREALKPFASYAAEWDDPTAYGLNEPWPDTELAYDPVVRIEIGVFRRARAALKETTDV